MIIMRPIDEPLVLESLNASRFGQNVRGYVIMDSENYMGHALFSVSGKTVNVCECIVNSNALVDGAVRACIAAGENASAEFFTVNTKEENLNKWHEIFCKSDKNPQIIADFLQNCK